LHLKALTLLSAKVYVQIITKENLFVNTKINQYYRDINILMFFVFLDVNVRL